jgi:hypothetical protein
MARIQELDAPPAATVRIRAIDEVDGELKPILN